MNVTWTDNPSPPAYRPPVGAVDAHCHVFGPAARFPFAPERKYTPADAPAETLYALRDKLGLSRNVIVQASCHGRDNSALMNALTMAAGQARGIAIIDKGTSLAELREMHDVGIRGVRFNFIKRLVDAPPHDQLARIAEKVATLGWHIVTYFEAGDLEGLVPFLTSLPTPIVIDHMGRPDIQKGPDSHGFVHFMDFLESSPNIWVKVSCPERLTVEGPPYRDVVPFAKRLVQRFPDRVLWGTDWPHPNMTSHIPDDGALLDLVPSIAPEKTQQQALLVDNPMRLYWPEEGGVA